MTDMPAKSDRAERIMIVGLDAQIDELRQWGNNYRRLQRVTEATRQETHSYHHL